MLYGPWVMEKYTYKVHCITHDPWVTHSPSTMGYTTIYPVVQLMMHGPFISLYNVVYPMGRGILSHYIPHGSWEKVVERCVRDPDTTLVPELQG